MKLYYAKGACSLSPHIVLEELGLPYEAVCVDLNQPPTADFLKLNPLGAVPVLVLDNGEPLTEGSVIVQYLADLRPEAGLAPRPGTLERVRLQEWLTFIATEIHKGFGPLWALDYMVSSPAAREELRNFTIAGLGERFDLVASRLGDREYLMPSGFTIADPYLFTLLNWAGYLKVDLSRWPTLKAYMDRVRSRPGVMKALKAEHLA